MKLFVAIFDDYALLPHFIRHYRQLGITHFYVAASSNIAPSIRHAVAGVSATIRDDLDVADSLIGGAQAVTSMRSEYSTPNEWVAIVDLDEFVVLPRHLTEVVAIAEREGANVVRGQMIDRVSTDGSLPPIHANTDLWATFPHRCRLTSMLQGSVDYKGVLVRGHLASSMAHHEFIDERRSQQSAEVHHFKWNAAAVSRLRAAMQMARIAEITWWPEYLRVLEHLEQHGRIRWEDYLVSEGRTTP